MIHEGRNEVPDRIDVAASVSHTEKTAALDSPASFLLWFHAQGSLALRAAHELQVFISHDEAGGGASSALALVATERPAQVILKLPQSAPTASPERPQERRQASAAWGPQGGPITLERACHGPVILAKAQRLDMHDAQSQLLVVAPVRPKAAVLG